MLLLHNQGTSTQCVKIGPGATRRDLHMYGAIRKKTHKRQGRGCRAKRSCSLIGFVKTKGGWGLSSSGNQGAVCILSRSPVQLSTLTLYTHWARHNEWLTTLGKTMCSSPFPCPTHTRWQGMFDVHTHIHTLTLVCLSVWMWLWTWICLRVCACDSVCKIHSYLVVKMIRLGTQLLPMACLPIAHW